jgi:hypothetical protein
MPPQKTADEICDGPRTVRQTAHDLMRHSDINLTMSRYTHTLRGQLAAAIDSLPDFSKPDAEAAKKTGTDDVAVTHEKIPAVTPAVNCEKWQKRANDNKQKGENVNCLESAETTVKRGFSREKPLRPEGLEPATCGLGIPISCFVTCCMTIFY